MVENTLEAKTVPIGVKSWSKKRGRPAKATKALLRQPNHVIQPPVIEPTTTRKKPLIENALNSFSGPSRNTRAAKARLANAETNADAPISKKRRII
jgi:hypothetical protein